MPFRFEQIYCKRDTVAANSAGAAAYFRTERSICYYLLLLSGEDQRDVQAVCHR